MKDLFNGFFKGKNVLITGHTGFIGSWMTIWLLELGANVIGYALPPYSEKTNYTIAKLDQKITNYYADIRDYDKLLSVFQKEKPEIIFHLAAQSIVRKSYHTPKETFDTNVGGTVNVFESFRKKNESKVLINITTDKVYENRESNEGYKEDDRLGGYDPYSSSKACSELITNAFKNAYFCESSPRNQKIVSTARSGNVIGGGDWQVDRIIPDCMRAILENKEILIRNPKSIRPWQYVLEPIRGYLILAKQMGKFNIKYSGAWNFGPEELNILTVEELVKKLINYLKKGSYKTQTPEDSEKLHETKILKLNSTKSKTLLNWKPVLTPDQMIKFTCDWYIQKDIAYEYDVSLINEYLKLVNTLS
jgi:CDP-glucose 4,6-dehydratase